MRLSPAVTIAAIAACSAQKPIEHGVSMHAAVNVPLIRYERRNGAASALSETRARVEVSSAMRISSSKSIVFPCAPQLTSPR